jgi:hypothetical protein
MLFKNITKKRDVRERIFRTTQATFVTKLRVDIIQDLKKLTSSTTVCVYIHEIILTLLIQIDFNKFLWSILFYFYFFKGGGGGGCSCVLYCSMY